MAINYIIAIVRESQVKSIVAKLYEHNVPGVSVSTVKGCGEHVNLSKDDLEESMRIEVFVAEKNAHHVVNIIMQSGHTGLEGDGIVAILPVNEIHMIRDYSKIRDENLMLT
ncbi:MAG: P-II family nitrogen regulator [Gammaproteobacteria bacterium]|nr:P-II family nitrogen regulator [Gammaproteobacteria bacterium]